MLFTNGTGTGKAQPLDARLMTPTGWVLMGDIRPGDHVMGADGRPTRVLSVHPQGEKPIYRVTFSDGAITECCDEHLWETQTLYERRKAAANPAWECAKPEVRSLAQIRETLAAQHFVPIADALEFEAVELPIPAYIMGALLGDGCITQNAITFSTADPEIAERVTRDLPADMELRLIADGKRCPQYRISLIEQVRRANGQMEQHPWLRALRAMSLHGSDSASKFVPGSYLRGSIKQRIELLQGLLDTDGWVDGGSHSPYFTSISRALADAVAFLSRSLGGTATINTKRPTYSYQGAKHFGQLAYNVCLNLPAGIAPFALARKAVLYQANTKYPPRRKIVDIEPIGIKAAQCIAVDHPRHLYVTDDCVVTHNTYTGLGIARRFERQGKGNILIVAPTQKVIEDWVRSGKNLGLNIKPLEGTTDNGKSGIVITTYANLGANDSLGRRDWDLVITDEAHYLMQEKDGNPTGFLHNLRAISMHPRGQHRLAEMRYHKEFAAFKTAMEAMDQAQKAKRSGAVMDALKASLNTARKAWTDAQDKTKALVESRQGAARTRVTFLSATPFAYEKNVDYAEGYLFNYEAERTDGGYNSGSPFDRFMMQHFGYSMRTGKLNQPGPEVDSGLMQRQFNAWLKREKVLSGRMLDVKPDYDRKFVLVESAIGRRIDEALDWLRAEGETDRAQIAGRQELHKIVSSQFDYLRRRFLLEAIKAQDVIPVIKAHQALGRKVVVFHDYKKGGGFHPFKIQIPQGLEVGYSDSSSPTRGGSVAIEPIYEDFKRTFKDLISHPFEKMDSPIDALGKAFPNAQFFNGDVPIAKRKEAVSRFQADGSPYDLIVVQSAAGKEGISLHDTSGQHQRVLINLGLPTQPTTAIQQEGRIYRTGQMTDALMRYLNTGTSWERQAFANTIARRASTAENLAQGEGARALLDSFIQSFEESDTYEPGHDGEGKGGKERDKAMQQMLSEFDRAKTYYFSQQKKNSRTKSAEGIDYFATPEPVGLKMVEFLRLRSGEHSLEPSGGHGAIARWLPDNTHRRAIEPSRELSTRLALAFDGEIVNDRFENHNIVNKYDGIVMNPPYNHPNAKGAGLAFEHLAKAWTHLREGGRIVALLPTGPAADKRLEKFLDEGYRKVVDPLYKDERLGAIYRGDTLTFEYGGISHKKVVRAVDQPGMYDGKPGAVYVSFQDPAFPTINLAVVTAVDPTGKSVVKKEEAPQLVADILLPTVTFERAGTGVMTHIIVLQKGAFDGQTINRDYTDEESIKGLFDRIENLDMPDRPVKAEPVAPAAPTVSAATPSAASKPYPTPGAAPASGGFTSFDQPHTQKGGTQYMAAFTSRVEREAYDAASALAKKHGGYYSRYQNKATNTKAGFTFKTAAARDAFVAEAGAQSLAEGPVYKRSDTRTSPSNGLSLSEARAEADRLTAGWENAPPVTVLASPADAPFDAPDDANGAIYRGQVYLFANNLRTAAELQFTLFHETLGHAGLRGMLGAGMDAELRRIANLNAGVRRAANTWSERLGSDAIRQRVETGMTRAQARSKVRLLAIEEALADMAGSGKPISGLQRFMAKVQELLRAIGFDQVANWLENATDAEVASLLAKAREWVEGDIHVTTAGELAATFSRSTDEDLDELLQERGESVATIMDAERRFNDGERLFTAHDMGDTPTEITSTSQLKGYTADQIIALPVDETLRDIAPAAESVRSDYSKIVEASYEALGISDESPARVSALRELRKLRKRLEDDDIGEADFVERAQELLDRLEEQAANKAGTFKARERGAEWLRERLMRARRKGELPADAMTFALWAIDRNPDMVGRLGLSIRTPKGDEAGAAANYAPLTRVMTLFKGVDKLDSAVHEILHHTERLMPLAVQKQITKAWLRAIASAVKEAAGELDVAKLDLLDAMIEAVAGSHTAAKKVRDAFIDGTLEYDDYQLTSPSEYWAVNGTRIMASRFAAGRSWVRTARQWFKEMIQKVMDILGLASDAPIIRALNGVLESDGKDLSPSVMAENLANLADIKDGDLLSAYDTAALKEKTDREEAARKVEEKARIDALRPRGKKVTAHQDEMFEGQQALFSRAQAAQDAVQPSLRERARQAIMRADSVIEPLGNLPAQKAYLTGRYLALGRIANVDGIAKKVGDMFHKATAADRAAAYEYLTTAGASPLTIVGEETRRQTMTVKKLIGSVGDALVARGLLSEEAREEYRDRYLPRLYLKHVLSESDWTALGGGKKVSDMGYLKARKDIPEEVRAVILGEITDPGFLAATGIAKPMRDMALLDWLASIAGNTEWVDKGSVAQWEGARVSVRWLQLGAARLRKQAAYYTPENAAKALAMAKDMDAVVDAATDGAAPDPALYKQIPDTARYGRLRGAWVRREIYDDMMGVADFLPQDAGWWQSIVGYGGVGTRVTQLWKLSKVALNPPGQVRNFVSNMVMLHLSGVPLHRLPDTMIRAARQIMSDGPMYKMAKKYGVTASTFSNQELGRIRTDLLNLELRTKGLHPLARLKMLFGIIANGASDLYQFTETMFKTAKIMDGIQRQKLSEADAAIEAHKWMFDYSLVSQNVRYMRNAPIGVPFVTYFTKVLPRLLETALLHPQRLLPWVGLYYALPALAASAFGVDEDELDKLKKALPEWLQRRGNAFFLPYKDELGRVQALDLGYFFPWGQWQEFAGALAETAKSMVDGKSPTAGLSEAMRAAGLFSGPVTDIVVAMKTNEDSFTGRDIINKADPPARQAAALANYMWDMAMPPFIGSRGILSPMGLIDEQYGGKAVQAALGTTNKFGEPRNTTAQAALALFGVNLYAVDPDHTRATNILGKQREMQDVEARLKQQLTDRGMSDERKQGLVRDYLAEIGRRNKELQEYMAASEVHPNLKAGQQ